MWPFLKHVRGSFFPEHGPFYIHEHVSVARRVFGLFFVKSWDRPPACVQLHRVLMSVVVLVRRAVALMYGALFSPLPRSPNSLDCQMCCYLILCRMLKLDSRYHPVLSD